jgi:hypothetical protein
MLPSLPPHQTLLSTTATQSILIGGWLIICLGSLPFTATFQSPSTVETLGDLPIGEAPESSFKILGTLIFGELPAAAICRTPDCLALEKLRVASTSKDVDICLARVAAVVKLPAFLDGFPASKAGLFGSDIGVCFSLY